jgi:myo-inositol-1(or 4)-monophosphatase
MLNVAIETAREAGKYLKQHLGKIRNIQVKDGQEKNLVTEIDKKSEEMIIGNIRKHFPGHSILAEEGGVGAEQSDYKWIIDPLDGTANYTHGFPVFSVSIGLEFKGELIAGVIYDPNFDEMFSAEKGKGAYLNGRKIRVSSAKTLDHSMLVTGFPYNISENPDHAVEHFVTFLMKAQAVRRMGSAAIDLAYVAAGRLDAFWEVALQPWDMAAGIVLVREAGGVVTNFAGNPINVYNKQLLASNGIIHEEMKQILASPMK